MKTFKQFIQEAKEPKPDALKTISRNIERKHKGVTLHASEIGTGPHKGSIRLHNIFVPTPNQGKGLGSKIMKGMTNYANRTGKNIRLSQSAAPGREGDLKRFYRKFGFKKVNDDNYERKPA
jgi:GNAT superfamily N-acetyltransferase